jgi:hypothetical protein
VIEKITMPYRQSLGAIAKKNEPPAILR